MSRCLVFALLCACSRPVTAPATAPDPRAFAARVARLSTARMWDDLCQRYRGAAATLLASRIPYSAGVGTIDGPETLMRAAAADAHLRSAIAEYTRVFPKDRASAERAFEALPPAVRELRPIQFARLAWDSSVAWLRHLEARYPGEPALDYLEWSIMAREGRYPEALAAIDRLDAVVHDPALEKHRAALRAK